MRCGCSCNQADIIALSKRTRVISEYKIEYEYCHCSSGLYDPFVTITENLCRTALIAHLPALHCPPRRDEGPSIKYVRKFLRLLIPFPHHISCNLSVLLVLKIGQFLEPEPLLPPRADVLDGRPLDEDEWQSGEGMPHKQACHRRRLPDNRHQSRRPRRLSRILTQTQIN